MKTAGQSFAETEGGYSFLFDKKKGVSGLGKRSVFFSLRGFFAKLREGWDGLFKKGFLRNSRKSPSPERELSAEGGAVFPAFAPQIQPQYADIPVQTVEEAGATIVWDPQHHVPTWTSAWTNIALVVHVEAMSGRHLSLGDVIARSSGMMRRELAEFVDVPNEARLSAREKLEESLAECGIEKSVASAIVSLSLSPQTEEGVLATQSIEEAVRKNREIDPAAAAWAQSWIKMASAIESGGFSPEAGKNILDDFHFYSPDFEPSHRDLQSVAKHMEHLHFKPETIEAVKDMIIDRALADVAGKVYSSEGLLEVSGAFTAVSRRVPLDLSVNKVQVTDSLLALLAEQEFARSPAPAKARNTPPRATMWSKA